MKLMRSFIVVNAIIIILYPQFLFGQRYFEDIFSVQNTASDVVYGNSINDLGESKNLLLDFYEPEGDLEENRPLIIWVHGGSFTSGSKADFTLQVFTDYLVPKGYTSAHVSYRLSSQDILVGNNAEIDSLALFKAAHNGVHDVRAAVRFFKLNASSYRIDPDRIYVAGISAGAIIGVELGYIDRINELYPDAVPQSVEGNSGNDGASSDVAGVISLCGTSIFPEIIEGPADPPLFMAHDLRDPIVPYENARATYDQASNVGTFAVGIFYDSGLHCSWSIPLLGFFNLIDVQNQLKTFLFNRVSVSNEADLAKSSVSTFPNPFREQVHIKGLGSETYSYSIADILGKKLVSGRMHGNSTNTINQLGFLAPGLYVLVISEQSSGTVNHFSRTIVKRD